MPTTLFVQQQHHPPPFGLGGDDCDVHYIHHPNGLYIISEHDYVRSLIPPALCDVRVKALPDRKAPRRFQTPVRRRSPLMATVTYAHDASMALGGPPGSPPDLTNSKSSKSSSFHSSNLSDVMGPSDLSHFEDINLDDVQASRSSVSNTRSMAHPHASAHSFRDLTGAGKPRYPSLKGQVNTAMRQQSQLNAPNRTMRRGFTSPSAPSLANITNLAAPGRRSRSPSPSHPQAFPSAPRSLSRRSSRNTLDVSPALGTNSRRQSWQHPARKTAKELEAECDDEDDEVPEELLMYNVPISPRPAQERSPAPSACNSPPQASASPATSQPSSKRGSMVSLKNSPAISQKPLSQPSSPNPANSENIPPQPLTRQRTNTWEESYHALDPDSKKITEALEEYQSGIEREQGIKRQQSGLSRSSSLVEEKPRSSKSALPPIRKSDPLIDPFQPSAEKEKHLSRTRPSWLPPKDPKEEKKHLKEYAKIQARVQEALREQEQKEEEEKLARERAGRKKSDMWENDLLPQYATKIATPEGKSTYRQLWWSGTPSKIRGIVWKTAIGNELEISGTTFKVALDKAQNQIKELGERALDGKVATIIENTKQVFPDLKMFGPESKEGAEQPYHRDLVNICLAYTLYRPDVDTLTGIHHIAGLFLLNMSVLDTFICLGNLLNRPLPLSFLVRDHTAITAAYDITLSALAKKAPSLARRFEDLRVEPRDYLQPMFSSLFCDRLPVEHAARLMDVYVIEGDKIATRAAVGFLGIREGKLYQGGVEDVVKSLNMKEMRMHPDEFMAKVYEAGKST